MAVWEYKVITSGKGGFATPALLESFLNQLGKDEWEIIHFQSPPDNALAFTGLVRRPTQRDWTLEDAAATAARAEADKLRVEFEAKFKGMASASGPEEKPESIAAETAASDDGLRRLRNTERDLDPDAPEEEGEPDDWEKLASEDELPTFFEAIQPLMRRNQRGPGLSVGVDQVAKKWGMDEDDVVGALKECGFAIPDDEDAKPAYLEYDGDLFWVNVNRRGELWINTKEKPRPVFRTVSGTKVETPAGSEPAPASPAEKPIPFPVEKAPEHSAPSSSLPEGPVLLEKIRPLMRRNRGGAGGSGSTGFLSRALKCREADLMAAFATLGLVLPDTPGEAPVEREIGGQLWWLNRDQRGGVWINGSDAKKAGAGEPSPANAEDAPPPAAAGSDSIPVLAAVRLLLKRTKTGAVAGETANLGETLGKSPEEFLTALQEVGLKVPEKPREKPVFISHAGEVFWLNRNAKGELWLNAKASKFSASKNGSSSDASAASKSRRGRSKGSDSAPAESTTVGEPSH